LPPAARLAGGRSEHFEVVNLRISTVWARWAYLDIRRIRRDSGYQPHHGVQRGMADYIGPLNAGHER
jgi:nucleoside-diphosphate-sugar epimerase